MHILHSSFCRCRVKTIIEFYVEKLNRHLVPTKVTWMMNEWMMHLYSAFIVYCHTPKALYNHVGGLSSTTTSVQHPLGWCDGSHRTTAPVRSPHTSYRWRGERVIEPIKLMGIIGRPWLTRASGGKLARTPGLHPYSLREVPWDF